ncbi:hypothetical protein GCM10010518_35400 [Kitasatospora cinereorecta]
MERAGRPLVRSTTILALRPAADEHSVRIALGIRTRPRRSRPGPRGSPVRWRDQLFPPSVPGGEVASKAVRKRASTSSPPSPSSRAWCIHSFSTVRSGRSGPDPGSVRERAMKVPRSRAYLREPRPFELAVGLERRVRVDLGGGGYLCGRGQPVTLLQRAHPQGLFDLAHDLEIPRHTAAPVDAEHDHVHHLPLGCRYLAFRAAH